LLRWIGNPREFLFPGFLMLGFGIAGAISGWRSGGRQRVLAIFYASLVALACWVSFGPDAVLYRVLYDVIPGFTFMRAPSRFGVVVAFALAPLAGMAIAQLLSKSRQKAALFNALLGAAIIAELAVPLHMRQVPEFAPVYGVLATLPGGPVLELPVYSHPFRFA